MRKRSSVLAYVAALAISSGLSNQSYAKTSEIDLSSETASGNSDDLIAYSAITSGVIALGATAFYVARRKRASTNRTNSESVIGTAKRTSTETYGGGTGRSTRLASLHGVIPSGKRGF